MALDWDVKDLAEGRITKKEFLERQKARAIGGGIGLAALATIRFGPSVGMAILTWTSRNPDKAHKVAQEAVQASSGNPTASRGLTSAEVGLLREAKVATLTGGRVARQEVIVKGLGRTDIDVIGKAGEYIAVGGPAKTPSGVGKQLQILQKAAEQAGVKALAYFAKGTPEEVLKVARKKLGAENVHIFEDVQ